MYTRRKKTKHKWDKRKYLGISFFSFCYIMGSMENNIFILVCSCLIPAIMIGFGFMMWKFHPKEISYFFGYRTARSMQSLDAWNFANEYEGKLWVQWGLIVLVPTVLLFIWLQDRMTTISIGIIVVQAVVLLATIFPVERALKKNFDENGNRK